MAAYTIVDKEQYQNDPEGSLNTLGESDWYVALEDALGEVATDEGRTLLVLYRDSNGEISEDSTLLGQDAVIEALNALGETGSAKFTGAGDREFWVRREENADWHFAGVVIDAVAAKQTVEDYFFESVRVARAVSASFEKEMEQTVRSFWGMACPACGEDSRIDVDALVALRLTPDGTDIMQSGSSSEEWDDDSPAICCACGHSGTVDDFTIKEEQK